MPALFLLLQVALALHHHHFSSYHDNKDSLHSASTAFYPDHKKQDFLICFAAEVLAGPPSCLKIRDIDGSKAPITDLIIAPPQSRAPPKTEFS
jgi:hypothetical protein